MSHHWFLFVSNYFGTAYLIFVHVTKRQRLWSIIVQNDGGGLPLASACQAVFRYPLCGSARNAPIAVISEPFRLSQRCGIPQNCRAPFSWPVVLCR